MRNDECGMRNEDGATKAELCPRCLGVPVAAVRGCAGCLDCDFIGTRKAFLKMQRMDREAGNALDELLALRDVYQEEPDR